MRSKVRVSGVRSSLTEATAVCDCSLLVHKARPNEGVHGRGIGSKKGLSGRGYVNGGHVAYPNFSPPPFQDILHPRPHGDGGGCS